MSEDWQVDAELLERWCAGDNDAGHQIYLRHGDAVIRFFRNKVRDEAEDLVQTTFMRLAAAKQRIEHGTTLRAYILGIAHRVLLEHLRKLEKGRAVDLEHDAMAAVIPGPSTIFARKIETRILLEGLRRIPIQQQIILELYYWEGLKANKIAEIMGINHSTMRGRVQRARDLLEKTIAELAEAPDNIASTLADLEKWAAEVRVEYLRGHRKKDDSSES
jgi:RNA polymerase sigma factor (sigma-70 family)